jgi:hypothetical protein
LDFLDPCSICNFFLGLIKLETYLIKWPLCFKLKKGDRYGNSCFGKTSTGHRITD